MTNIIERSHYFKRVEPFVGKEIIKVIVGQRRVGKSFFLNYIKNSILANDEKNIIYVNKELYEFDRIKDYHDLLEFVQSNLSKIRQNVLLVDEIQDIINFELALRSLFAEGDFDIYISGSNAQLLSGELATHLSGRYIQILIYSLSFKEFLQFHKLKVSKKSLDKYMKFGGLPYLMHLELTEAVVNDYLRNIYSSVLLKDVVSRYNVRNVALLENLVKYLAENTGNIVSAKKISDFLKSQRTFISPNIILNYLSYLESAFLIHRVKRQDIAGKKIFEVGEKIYFQDIGLKNAIVPFKQNMIGQILENLVYNHILYCGYSVHVGQMGTKEIDFVCEKAGDKIYIQVTYLLSDDSVVEREFGNLLQIKDNYRKIVTSMDDSFGGNIQGIEHIKIIDFLSSSF